ncbi:hypothetical protein D3C80_2156970 [compost metagenome]
MYVRVDPASAQAVVPRQIQLFVGTGISRQLPDDGNLTRLNSHIGQGVVHQPGAPDD